MKTTLSIITILLFSPILLATNSVDQGTAALKNKDYAKAVDIYQALLDEGQSSGELHYNMGVAYAELGTIGRSIWHFQLADKIGLSTDDLKHNLQLVREQRQDEIEVIPAFFLTRWSKVCSGLMPSNIWAILALLLVIGGIYGLYQWRTAEHRTQRKAGFSYGLPLLLLSMVFALTAYNSAKQTLQPCQGILLAKQLDLRSAPDYDSAGILTIHEGVDVSVQDEIGAWVKVRLLNGQEGWIPLSEIGLF